MHAKDDAGRRKRPVHRTAEETDQRDATDPRTLQSTLGNAAVARLVGRPPVPGSPVQSSAAPGSTGPGPAVQRSAVHEVLNTSGRPLDAPVRAEMEARLGADFSDVRVHDDTAARRSAAELGARAYTSGTDVVVGAGGADRHTLAHELTHVIQQRTGPVATSTQVDGVALSDPGDRDERAAEDNAHRVLAGPVPQRPEPEHEATADRVAQRTPVVQRMTMNQFNQTLADRNLDTDQDFITFFEIRRGRAAPAAVVADPTPGSAQRLQQFVTAPEFDQAALDADIAAYQSGTGGGRQEVAEVQDPNVAGLEMEMRNAALRPTPGMANGDEIAHTAARTAVGRLPVMKLELEGMDSGTPAMELIYGPLPVTTYQNPALVSTRRKLMTAVRRSGTMQQLVDSYNGSLSGNAEQRYALVVGPNPGRNKKSTPTPNVNTQTNVSTPYDKVGNEQGPAAENFEKFYDPRSRSAKTMYTKARTDAVATVGAINANWAATQQATAGPLAATSNLTSLLTQLVLQEAMYIQHSVDRDTVRPGDKHHFHVLFKISPQDAVLTILSDGDAKLLLAWLVQNQAQPLAIAAQTAFRLVSPNSQVTVDPAPIFAYLVDALIARLLAGRQLLGSADDATRTSAVRGEGRQVADVAHTHPRPSSRIPIVRRGERYYFVVEQRSSAHPMNRDAVSSPAAAVDQIRNLQR